MCSRRFLSFNRTIRYIAVQSSSVTWHKTWPVNSPPPSFYESFTLYAHDESAGGRYHSLLYPSRLGYTVASGIPYSVPGPTVCGTHEFSTYIHIWLLRYVVRLLKRGVSLYGTGTVAHVVHTSHRPVHTGSLFELDDARAYRNVMGGGRKTIENILFSPPRKYFQYSRKRIVVSVPPPPGELWIRSWNKL